MNRIERDVYTELEAAALAALLLLREIGHNGPSFLITERLRRAYSQDCPLVRTSPLRFRCA